MNSNGGRQTTLANNGKQPPRCVGGLDWTYRSGGGENCVYIFRRDALLHHLLSVDMNNS